MSILTDATLIAADGGVTDLVNAKAFDIEQTIKILAQAFVVGILLQQTFRGGFTLSKLLLNGLLAGIFIFIVNNPDFLASKTEAELNGAPPAIMQVHHDGDL